MRICIKIIFHLSKLWKAKFSLLCDVIFLVGLEGKFDIDHSQKWKGLSSVWKLRCYNCWMTIISAERELKLSTCQSISIQSIHLYSLHINIIAHHSFKILIAVLGARRSVQARLNWGDALMYRCPIIGFLLFFLLMFSGPIVKDSHRWGALCKSVGAWLPSWLQDPWHFEASVPRCANPVPDSNSNC